VSPRRVHEDVAHELLNDWRDQAVRRNIRSHTYNGRTFPSTSRDVPAAVPHGQGGILRPMHAYSGVQGPYCWDCHVDPQLLGRPPGEAFPCRQENG